VRGAAQIAAFLAPRWQHLNFYRILPSPASSSGALEQVHFFHLETHGGSKVVWGHPPGSEAQGEPSAMEKLDRLARYVKEVRPLDGPGPRLEFNLVSGEELWPVQPMANDNRVPRQSR
jgi:hypothetical protein